MQSRQFKCASVSTINVSDCFELYFGCFTIAFVLLKNKMFIFFVLLRLLFWDGGRSIIMYKVCSCVYLFNFLKYQYGKLKCVWARLPRHKDF